MNRTITRSKTNEMARQKIVTAIVEYAEKLGEAPSLQQLMRVSNCTKRQVRRHFGTYAAALRECNLERYGGGAKVPLETLFHDWAMVVRALQKLPSGTEYERNSHYSRRPLVTRFGTWNLVPHGLKQFIHAQGAKEPKWLEEWKDVLELIEANDKPETEKDETPEGLVRGNGGRRWKPVQGGTDRRWQAFPDRPFYGPLIHPYPLAHGPMNELGVLFLFGTVAAEMGFVVTWIRMEFPDCEAMILVGDDKWQRIRIEFEYESRNFLKHMHDAKECDLIVCWKHNWPECPVKVLELRKVLEDRMIW
ncbi:hypothetical protein AYO50_01020 [Acidobacteria bacterium SCGC AG-212-P17]|nr:hypothetical protein AYO50_01020 [Acidobacteria bacterium SCGC AG-212-P17]